MSEKVIYRGNSNSLNQSYDDTVADYSSYSSSTGDNTIENVTCDSSVFVGAIVRMSSGVAVNAIATSSASSRVVGICTSKSSATICNIQVCGFMSNIITGMTPDRNYFLSASTAGQITTTAPTGSSQIVLHIGRSLTSSLFSVQIGTQVRRAS